MESKFKLYMAGFAFGTLVMGIMVLLLDYVSPELAVAVGLFGLFLGVVLGIALSVPRKDEPMSDEELVRYYNELRPEDRMPYVSEGNKEEED